MCEYIDKLRKTNIMEKPNLFSFATKELSQDAFICWLLAWADKAYENDDYELHSCSMKFVQAILSKFDLKITPVIETIQIKPQYKHIDILVLLNARLENLKPKEPLPENSFAIIIEDKVGSSQHSDQLQRYAQTIKNLGFKDENILRLYLKTRDQIHYRKIQAEGYKEFTRKDFLAVLKSFNGNNEILRDFENYWQKAEDDTNSYKSLELTKWGNYSWRGFYKALNDADDIGLNQEEAVWLTSSYSTKLSKPTYSNLFGQDMHGCRLYIQLCQKVLNIKIKVTDKSINKSDMQQLRNSWLKLLNAKDLGGGIVIKRPIRIGVGKAMVIGTLDNYIAYEDGKVSLFKTIQNLRKIEEFLIGLETFK